MFAEEASSARLCLLVPATTWALRLRLASTMVVVAAAAQKMNDDDGAWRRQQQAKPFSSSYFIICLFLIISIHTQSIYFCLFNKKISHQKIRWHEFRRNLSQLAGLRREYQDFNEISTRDWHILTFVSKQHFLEFDKKLSEFGKFLAEPTLDKSLHSSSQYYFFIRDWTTDLWKINLVVKRNLIQISW